MVELLDKERLLLLPRDDGPILEKSIANVRSIIFSSVSFVIRLLS